MDMTYEVYKFRYDNGLTQKEFGALIGVKQQHVRFWESGMCRWRKGPKEKALKAMENYRAKELVK